MLTLLWGLSGVVACGAVLLHLFHRRLRVSPRVRQILT